MLAVPLPPRMPAEMGALGRDLGIPLGSQTRLAQSTVTPCPERHLLSPSPASPFVPLPCGSWAPGEAGPGAMPAAPCCVRLGVTRGQWNRALRGRVLPRVPPPPQEAGMLLSRTETPLKNCGLASCWVLFLSPVPLSPWSSVVALN